MDKLEKFATKVRGAIVTRMLCEEAASVDDSEIARTLAPCVSGRRLIVAARYLRDTGLLSNADVRAA